MPSRGCVLESALRGGTPSNAHQSHTARTRFGNGQSQPGLLPPCGLSWRRHVLASQLHQHLRSSCTLHSQLQAVACLPPRVALCWLSNRGPAPALGKAGTTPPGVGARLGPGTLYWSACTCTQMSPPSIHQQWETEKLQGTQNNCLQSKWGNYEQQDSKRPKSTAPSKCQEHDSCLQHHQEGVRRPPKAFPLARPTNAPPSAHLKNQPTLLQDSS